MQDQPVVPESEPRVSPTQSGQGAERRKFVRYQVRLPCDFSGDQSAIKGCVVDVSTGGCKVEAEWKTPPSEYLRLSLQSVTPDRPIVVDLAVVRWVRGGAFGVEFIRMEPKQQERLRLLVQYVEQDATL